jgi:hypothetical protein
MFQLIEKEMAGRAGTQRYFVEEYAPPNNFLRTNRKRWTRTPKRGDVERGLSGRSSNLPFQFMCSVCSQEAAHVVVGLGICLS